VTYRILRLTPILIIIERPDVYFLKIKYQGTEGSVTYRGFTRSIIMRMGVVQKKPPKMETAKSSGVPTFTYICDPSV